MSAIGKVANEFGEQLVRLGMRSADDKSASLVSKLDVALERIANKGENRQPARLEKELGRHGVTKFELEQAEVGKLGRNEVLETSVKSDITYDPVVVSKNFTKLVKSLDGAKADHLTNVILNISKEFPDLKTSGELIEKAPFAFDGELLKQLRYGAGATTNKLNPEQLRGLGSKRKDMLPQISAADLLRTNFNRLVKADPAMSRAIQEVLRELPIAQGADIARAISEVPQKFSKEMRAALTEIPEGTDLAAKDMFKASDAGDAYLSYTLPDVNRATYKEEVYSSPLMDNLDQTTGHFDAPDYQFHVRYDVVGGAAGDRTAKLIKLFGDEDFSFDLETAREVAAALNTDIAGIPSIEMLSTREVEEYAAKLVRALPEDSRLLARLDEGAQVAPTVSTRRIFELQSDIVNEEIKATSAANKAASEGSPKRVAEELKYNFRTESLKRQLVDAHNDGQEEVWLAIRPKGHENLVRGDTVQKEYDTTMVRVAKKMTKRIGAKGKLENGWYKIALPAGGFSLPLLAEDSDKEIQRIDGQYPASEKAGIQQVMEDPNISNTDKLRAFRQSNRETGRYGSEVAPTASTSPSAQELNVPSPTEMAGKVQAALANGMAPNQLLESLASRYEGSTANSIMLEALQPKIDKMLASGVPEEQIAESLAAKGIQYEAQNRPISDDNNLDIGQAGPESNQVVTGPDSDQIKPIIDTSLEPGEIYTQLSNLHSQYSEMGYALLGWTGLSPESKAKAQQIEAETSALIQQGLAERGYEILGKSAEGALIVKDKDTGEPIEVDDEILSSLGAAGAEIGLSVAGGIAGAKYGATLAAPVPIPGARVAGAVVGGILGSALGVAGGRGADVYRHADDLNYSISMNEIMSKMADAGVADITAGLLGTTAFKLGKGLYKGGKAAGRTVISAYNLVVKGNPQGAVDALLKGLTLTDAKAIELVKIWERATGNSVLSSQALESGKLGAKDISGLLQSLALTQPRATAMVKAASQVSKTGGSKLSLGLDDRAAQVLKAAEDMTNENVVTTVQQGLDTYVSDTAKYFGSIKEIGVSQMADTGYRFDFNKVPLEAVVKETKDKVLNNAIRRDVDNYLQRIRQLSGKTAVAKVEASGELVTPSTIEAANPLREFGNLLELRSVVNQFFSDSRFKAFYNQKALHVAKESIDKEIASVANNVMPGGKAWLKHWREANTEYHKMKTLESNVLYKALTKDTVSAESAVKAITRGLSYESPSTFMQVLGKLPAKTRANAEGAVIRQLVEDSTVGFDGGHKAINFVKLSDGLQQMAFTQPAARDLKRVVSDMAQVYKNDPHLSQAVGNIPLPKFQNALTTDVTAKVKYAVASSVFHAIKARIPFSSNAGRAALVNHLSKVLDNPLNARSVDSLLKGLPDDPTLKTNLQNLAIQYTKFGKPENYGKVPVFKVVSSKDLGKGRETALGKGHIAYTDKATADKVAKATGTKVEEALALPKAFATEEDVTKLLGHTPSKAELRNPDVTQALKDKGFIGFAAEDKVLFFKN